MKNNKNHAFTLVELAIVIIIMGLLVAGSMAGMHLVRQSQLQGVITAFREHEEAITLFRDRFNYYPGDMPNFSSYYTDEEDGNGNWEVVGNATEDLYSWRHLYLAGFIEYPYTGTAGANPDPYITGENIPAARMKPGLFWLRSYGTGATIYGKTGTALEFTSIRSGFSPNIPGGGILTAHDALYIDRKIDDGYADGGFIYGVRSSSSDIENTAGACTDNKWTSATAAYSLAGESPHCRLIFWLGR